MIPFARSVLEIKILLAQGSKTYETEPVYVKVKPMHCFFVLTSGVRASNTRGFEKR